MTNKIRLKTVLKELNISLKRAINFLKNQKIKLENNLNSKIDNKTYEILIKKFKIIKNKRKYNNIITKTKDKNKNFKKKLFECKFKKVIRKPITIGKIDLKSYIDYKKKNNFSFKKNNTKFENNKKEKNANLISKNEKYKIKNIKYNKNKYKFKEKNKNKKYKEKKYTNKKRNFFIKNKKLKKKINNLKSDKKKNNLKINKETKNVKNEKNLEKKIIKIAKFATVNDLSVVMNIPQSDIINRFNSLGVFVTLNQRLNSNLINIIADEFKYKINFLSCDISYKEKNNKKELIERPPIITLMGHVNHGKTSLINKMIEKNNFIKETGNITQHIKAYSIITKNKKKITILDTPGHEAFSAMRSRGVKITDIAIIVISIDDKIMPQTIESINHAKMENTPIIFAINKVDKVGFDSNKNKIKEELARINILVEDWGGDYQIQEVSALTGFGIENLIDKILFESEMLSLKSNPFGLASGIVIESYLDKDKGYTTVAIIKNGTLKIGDYIVSGKSHGKVKSIMNEKGENIKEATLSQPVIIFGLNSAPTSGEKFNVFIDEKKAKKIAYKRSQIEREHKFITKKYLSIEDIGDRISMKNFKEINIILKGDVNGSLEAISDSLDKISTKENPIKIIYKNIGNITKSDIYLANASNSIIIGFNIKSSINSNHFAKKLNVKIFIYNVIYDIINYVKNILKSYDYCYKNKNIKGTIEIKNIFNIPKLGIIAGGIVVQGTISKNNEIKLIRNGKIIHNTIFFSIKRFKKDVKEVNKGYECGINIKNWNNIKIGDIIEAYEKK